MGNINNYKWLLILVCCIAIIFLPIKFSNNINTYAKIVPYKQFVAIKGSNGQIITHLINNYTGIVENVKTIQVDREDFATFDFINKNKIVSKNEQIALFTSSHTQYLYEEVKGEILEQEKLLNSQLSGEKASVITEQEKIYEISSVDYSNQKKIFDRKALLFDNQLISQEEYDIEKNLLDRLKLAEEKEEQTLLTLKTGIKNDDILVTKERIKLLKNQAEIMAKRISDYNICSPFDGSISGSSSLDTLFTVSLKNYYSVLVPVEIEEATKIELGQKVVLEEFLGVDSIKIDKVDSELKIINGMNFRVFRGMINTDKELLNTLYPCSIVSEKVTIKDLLFTKINSIFEI